MKKILINSILLSILFIVSIHALQAQSNNGTTELGPQNNIKSVKIGNTIILTDEKGKELGTIRKIGINLMYFDANNKRLGIIKIIGAQAFLFNNSGKQIGLVRKYGNTYILYSKDAKSEEGIARVTK